MSILEDRSPEHLASLSDARREALLSRLRAGASGNADVQFLMFELGVTRGRLHMAHETLRWVRQTVHQTFHVDQEPAECRRPVCAEIAKALGEGT